MIFLVGWLQPAWIILAMLVDGQHCGTTGSITATWLRRHQFAPRDGITVCTEFCMFSDCPCGIPLGSLADHGLNGLASNPGHISTKCSRNWLLLLKVLNEDLWLNAGYSVCFSSWFSSFLVSFYFFLFLFFISPSLSSLKHPIISPFCRWRVILQSRYRSLLSSLFSVCIRARVKLCSFTPGQKRHSLPLSPAWS